MIDTNDKIRSNFNLNYNQLFYFFVVATEGSIKNACQRLHLTQPTISVQIKSLEESLGVDLFIRKNRRLELSQMGRKILAQTQSIFELGHDIILTLEKDKHFTFDELRIGVVPSLPHSFVHSLTDESWSRANTHLQLTTANLVSLTSKINSGELDIILTDYPSPDMARYQSINLGNYPYVLVGRPEFSLSQSSLDGKTEPIPYIAFDRDGWLQKEIDCILKLGNWPLNEVGSTDSVDFARMEVLRGAATAILPENFVQDSLSSNELKVLARLPELSVNYWLMATHEGLSHSSVKQLLNSVLRNRSDYPWNPSSQVNNKVN